MQVICYGIIPLRKREDILELFVIRNLNGKWWGLPKGHPNEGESERETASRELKEETNLEIKEWLDIQPIDEFYSYTENGQEVEKKVRYFFAITSGSAKLDSSELMDGVWAKLDLAEEIMTYPEGKELIRRAKERL